MIWMIGSIMLRETRLRILLDELEVLMRTMTSFAMCLVTIMFGNIPKAPRKKIKRSRSKNMSRQNSMSESDIDRAMQFQATPELFYRNVSSKLSGMSHFVQDSPFQTRLPGEVASET
jgi:hypothetical protein